MGSLSQKLKAKKSVVGSFIGIGHPTIVELAGCSGFDFVVIDMEHSCISLETVENMLRASQCTKVEAIVRVPGVDESLIGRLLDAGAAGVQVPQVASREYAERAVRAAKYPPIGGRGYMPVSRASWLRNLGREEQIARANSESLVVVQIEGVEGIARIEEILCTEDLDVVFLGPYDLSMSLGLPGQVNHPKVKQAMQGVIEKARNHGVEVGVFADDAPSALDWMGLGVRYITVGLDISYLTSAFRSCLMELKGAS